MICVVVILYMVALNRMEGLPAAAERAAFISSLSHIKAGVKLHMVKMLTAGRKDELMERSGSNPMNLLLEAPGNYRGEVTEIDDGLRRGNWYFDASTGDLVYLVGEDSIENVTIENGEDTAPHDRIRFHLRNIEEEGEWQALMLVPRQPYEWHSGGTGQVRQQIMSNGDGP